MAVHELADRWSGAGGPVWAGFATTGEPQAAAVLRAGRAVNAAGSGWVPCSWRPGLLLDATATQAMAMDTEVAEPLGTALAELILQRYGEALAADRPLTASSDRMHL